MSIFDGIFHHITNNKRTMKREYKEQCQAISMAGRLADINEGLQKMKEGGAIPTTAHVFALRQLKEQCRIFINHMEGAKNGKEGGKG